MQTRTTSVTLITALVATLGCDRPAARVVAGDDAPEAFVGQSQLRQIYLEQGGFLVSPILEAPTLASRVAVWLSTTTDANELALDLEVRGWDDGEAGEWIAVDERWREGPQRVGRADLGALVDALELRFPATQADRVAGIVWSAVVPDPAESTELAVGARTPSTLQALAIAGVEPRSAWNARANTGCSDNANKDWITVHHSVSALQVDGTRADHAAAVRGIQAYHMDGRGYCDVGYHFAATADGTVWEAREARFLGAHTGSHNTNNAGIVFIGCFHPVADCNGLGGLVPPDVMLQGGGAAIGAIAQHYGITINAANVIGHRDNPDQSTSCPGDGLHDLLPQLRTIAGGGAVTPGTGKVQGVVWDLSVTTDAAQSEAAGARLPGATIAVSGGDTTTARDGDSYWSFDLAPGTYTFTATLAGYAPATREVQVSSGASLWASIGVSPAASALDLTIHVVDADTGEPIDNATVTVTGADPIQTNAAGDALVNLSAGDVTITAAAEGYESSTLTQSLLAGAPVRVDFALTPLVIDKPEDGEDDLEGRPRVERVTILPPLDAAGGCAATGSASVSLLALLAVLSRRRVRLSAVP